MLLKYLRSERRGKKPSIEQHAWVGMSGWEKDENFETQKNCAYRLQNKLNQLNRSGNPFNSLLNELKALILAYVYVMCENEAVAQRRTSRLLHNDYVL